MFASLILHMVSSALLVATMGSPVVDLYLVPHTHADVGWMQTVNSLSRINISRILDSVTEELVVNPTRRFVWDEMVFLQLWWETQATPAQRAAFTKHIVSRRIECKFARKHKSTHSLSTRDVRSWCSRCCDPQLSTMAGASTTWAARRWTR